MTSVPMLWRKPLKVRGLAGDEGDLVPTPHGTVRTDARAGRGHLTARRPYGSQWIRDRIKTAPGQGHHLTGCVAQVRVFGAGAGLCSIAHLIGKGTDTSRPPLLCLGRQRRRTRAGSGGEDGTLWS